MPLCKRYPNLISLRLDAAMFLFIFITSVFQSAYAGGGGAGTAPVVTLSATSLTFTAQAVGTSSTAQSVTLKNTGSSGLTITSIKASGDFSQTNTCGSSVAVGASCTLEVTFKPTATGTRTGAVTITDNASPATQTISLKGTGTAPLLSITTTSLPYGTVSTSYTTTLTATGGTKPLTWSHTDYLPTGLSLNSSTGVISGTPTAAGTWSFTVKVTDSTTPTALTATQGPRITIDWTAQALSITTTSLQDGTVGIAYSVSVNATGGTGVYRWSIASGGTFPTCLSLSSTTGFISGTPVNTCLGSFSFTVEVIDSASNHVMQPLSININPPSPPVCGSGNESVLYGQYAFNLSGYNSSGFNAVVGSVTANGAGHITGGEVDMNGAGASSATNSTISAYPASYYSVGADNRGCATIVTTSGTTFTTRLELGAVSGSPSTATAGRIIEFDPATSSAFIASGQIFQQTTATTPSASNFSALNGGYVYLLTGWDSSYKTRIACAGVDTYSGGYVSDSEQDCNDGGSSVTTGPISGIVGTYTSPDRYGRFTETLGVSPNQDTLAGYVVSTAGTGAVAITTSVGGANKQVLAGLGFQQRGGPYGLGSLNSTVVAFANGVNNNTSGKIKFALDHANGAGTFANDAYYENDGGIWTANGTTGSCTYTVATNGRASGCGGAIYIMAPNTAVIVGNDTGVFAGYVMPQTVPTGGFTPALIAGTFFGGTSEIVDQNAQAEGDKVTFLSGSGTALSGTDISDESSTTFQQADNVETISGATLGGKGTITETKNSPSQVTGVVVDTTHFLMVNNASSSYPTISVFGPSSPDRVALSISSPTTAQSVAANGGCFAITVKVAGTANTGVAWTLNGLPSGSGYGTISGSYPSFTYTAPTRVPSPAKFKITATSNADVSKSASVSVTISAGAGVSHLSITTTSLPSSTGGGAYVQNIQTSGGTLPIIWSVTSGSLPPGLGLQGTPDGVGTITGMPTASGTYTFTVTASDASTPTQYASQKFTIVVKNVPLSITTKALPMGTVGTAYSTLVAVSGGTTPYTWSVTGGAPPGGVTLNTSSGAITGTPSATGTSNFTVTVTDSTLPTHQTVNQSLSITINAFAPTCSVAPTGHESMLNGQYAFLVQQGYLASYFWTGNPPPLVIAASFHADGAGNVTGGDFDINEPIAGATYATINAGSYTVGLDSTGSGDVGCVALSLSDGVTTAFRFSLGGSSSGVYTKGRIIEFDDVTGAGNRGSGVILRQDPTSFALSQLQPHYAFGVDGAAYNGGNFTTSRAAAGGSFTVDTSGSISNVVADINLEGSWVGETTGGTGTINPISTTSGRATMSLPFGGGAANQVIYMVNADEFFLVSTDPMSSAPLYGGRAIVTASSFSLSSLSGNYIAHATGIHALCPGYPLNEEMPCTHIYLGLWNMDSGSQSGTMYNYEYYPSLSGPSGPTSFSGTYTVDATSGRVTIAGGPEATLYIATPTANTEPISAFLVDTYTTYVFFGFLESQPNQAYSTSGLAGNYMYATEDSNSRAISNETDVVSLSSGGTITGSGYKSGSSGLGTASPGGTITMGANGVGSASVGVSYVAITNGTRIYLIPSTSYDVYLQAVVIVLERQ